jgi:NTP pyrophosphatase (non-canonical NTP hydrolase)
MEKTTQTSVGVNYGEFVDGLVKPGADILKSLTPEKCHMWHMATLLVGEAAELLDAVKKHVVYNKALDEENIKEELGDTEFSLEAIRQIMRVTRQDIVTGNFNKLSKRYHLGVYSDAQAQNRADKA